MVKNREALKDMVERETRVLADKEMIGASASETNATDMLHLLDVDPEVPYPVYREGA